MSKKSLFPRENELAKRLRREAIRSRPEFSEELHSRLWRAVERDALGREVPIPDRPAAPRRVRFWAMAAVGAAAACALSVTVIGWRPRDVGLRPQVTAGGAADPNIDVVAGLADHVSTRLDALLDSAITKQRWAYLDHDARLAMELLNDHIPFDPATPQTPEQAASER